MQMPHDNDQTVNTDVLDALGATPILCASAGGAFVLEGTTGRSLSHDEAARYLSDTVCILCSSPLMARRVGLPAVRAMDVLELFAFLRPAEFLVPTGQGLAAALGLARPMPGLAAEAQLLRDIVKLLITDAMSPTYRWPKRAGSVANFMRDAGWGWGAYVSAIFAGQPSNASDLAIWRSLPEWEDGAPRPAPEDNKLAEATALERLQRLLGEGAEKREQQEAYVRAACYAFGPRETAEAPNLSVLEAGTGIGKTLGYIAPASAWAEQNGGVVWISTYTKNLQRQIDQELDRLYGDEKLKRRKVVVRKGRENYLCLLNLEEAIFQGRVPPGHEDKRALLGLILRWALYTRDGDMVGGDLPGWLAMHLGAARLGALSDRRGECVYSACAHYRRCFIEGVKRRARDADLVVANHALVMFEAAARGEDSDLGGRLIFDEGHHVFDAADGAFSLNLSGRETRELRRWLRGREGGRSSGRARGLKARIEELLAGDEKAVRLLEDVLEAARVLPDDGWLKRIHGAAPQGLVEVFLAHARAHVLARSTDKAGPHSLEAGVNDPSAELIEAASSLAEALAALVKPLVLLARALRRKLEDEADDLSSAERGRIDSAARALSMRADTVGQGWMRMLRLIGAPPEEDFVDWFVLERGEAREFDVGLCRHWVDPTKPFADVVLNSAHGVIITSATLRDRNVAEEEENWRGADIRSGAANMVLPPRHHSFRSPFDYGKKTRVFVVNDLDRNDGGAVAGAYRALFEASGGGALGLFTAISRLRAVYARIAPQLEANGLNLLAQHVDPVDAGTLVDMFRDDPNGCLLGTDAMRDGVDVPGDSLRLVVFDRVPWPRPDILHRARKAAFGGAVYDDMVTRLRLKQAFGRLVRRARDYGVFVMLDARTPSRLLDAFPPETPVQRVGLSEAVRETRAFLASMQK